MKSEISYLSWDVWYTLRSVAQTLSKGTLMIAKLNLRTLPDYMQHKMCWGCHDTKTPICLTRVPYSSLQKLGNAWWGIAIHDSELREFDHLCCMSSTPIGLHFMWFQFELKNNFLSCIAKSASQVLWLSRDSQDNNLFATSQGFWPNVRSQ